MQHDRSLPPSQRRNYSHAIDGLIRIAREESWRGLFRGVWPNSLRAMLMTSSQLASYDTFKSFLLSHPLSSIPFFRSSHLNFKFEDNLTTHFTASFLAGFVATTICSPVDVIKTRLMSAKHTPEESLWGILREVYKKEGWTWVFKGWLPSFIRLGPHTIVTFLFLEQHKRLWRRWREHQD